MERPEARMDEDEEPEMCPDCKQILEWSRWHIRPHLRGLDEVPEVRTGRCNCPGKTYLQTRPRPDEHKGRL